MSKNHAIGIDIGGTNLRAGLISHKGEVLKKAKESSTGNILQSVNKVIENLYTENVAGIGLGIAGLIDKKENVVFCSPNLRSVEGINFVKALHKQVAVPVIMENDANAAAFGERWMGAGRQFNHFVLLTLGTGIGGGIVYEGKLAGCAAEIGHMSIDINGKKCICGNNGCLELYAAANAMKSKIVSSIEKGTQSLMKGLYEGNFYKITAEDIYKSALEGDSLAREVIKEAGRYLGVGLANVINIVGPEAIILTGGLIGAWNIYVQEAIREASRRTFKPLFDNVKIIPSLLGDNAGIIGAAGLVFSASGRLA
ncbi:MAG: ROK family protein [Nitrospirae bacterium]|nr:ROK family protein [Nitrospirota bacterium]